MKQQKRPPPHRRKHALKAYNGIARWRDYTCSPNHSKALIKYSLGRPKMPRHLDEQDPEP